MANSTMLLPFTSELAEWLAGLGVSELPDIAGAPLSPDQVRRSLLDLGWSFSEDTREHEGTTVTNFWAQPRDAAWPPFTEINVGPDWVSVRHGGYAAYAIATRGAKACGPLVAVDSGGIGQALVTPNTPYQDFARAFAYEGDERRDAAWTPVS